MSRLEVFRQTYFNNSFKGKDSKSGRGSDMDIVSPLIPKLANLIDKYNIKTLIDAPCGDCNWIKEVLPSTKVENYIGIDIVPDLIDSNIENFGGTGLLFAVKDLVEEIPPTGDLLLCRDCLVHLSFESAIKALKNIVAANPSYVLLTTFTKDRTNISFSDGTNWYPMRLTAAPFNFPEPLAIINEGCTEGDGSFQDKSLGLWRTEEIKAHVESL